MPKVAIKVDAKQIESALEQLNSTERWRIAKEILKDQFRDVSSEFRKTIRRKNLTPKKLNHIIEKARVEFYAKGRG